MSTDPRNRRPATDGAAARPKGGRGRKRHWLARERERTAGGCEAAAGPQAGMEVWQEQLAAREERLDARGHAAADTDPYPSARPREQIVGDHQSLPDPADGPGYRKATPQPPNAADQSAQDDADQEISPLAPRRSGPAREPVEVLQCRAAQLRGRAAAAAGALAGTEEALARAYEDQHRDEQAAVHSRLAHQARQAADALSGTSPPPQNTNRS
ncbi:hypothetical protein GPA10_40945 [Streptomyces sp. p1417]|uniref:Uncharacterized protein n=1 Tax=Streptomyces typhae TaxID=2681492 RepID=A0A6L6XAM0_9ACTN|nr:hypothetical protein [Streptomyces typhae]MVO90942.1 hypothetical protein [Streptomyces typhae]